MKKIKIIMAFCMVILCSCQKNECVVCESREPQPETFTMTVGFGLVSTSTRSFLDDMVEGWDWESEIHRISFYVYRLGNLVVAVDAKREQIASGHIDLNLPIVLHDKEVAIYAVVNAKENIRPSSEEAMMKTTEQSSLYYLNQGLTVLREGSPIAGGLLMSGKASCILEDGLTVNIELKRAVAKIVLELRLSDEFYSTHGGSGFTLSNAKFFKQTSYTYIMAGNEPRNAGGLYTGHDSPCLNEDGVFRFVVYTHETDTGDLPCEIYVFGSFLLGTTNVSAMYTIPVDPDNPSLIRRNTCYCIKGEIYGVGITSTSVVAEIDEWITLSPQDIGIGR